MDQFIEVKEVFKTKNKFEEITRALMNKEIIKKGENIIQELECEVYLNSRDLLSSFLINKYPRDTVGDNTIETNKDLINYASKLLEKRYKNNDELKMDIVKYSYYFKTWKSEDVEILKNQLFNEYHQLTVDIMNTDDEEKKYIFEETQKRILECSFQIGGDDFVNQIHDYSPVLINTQDLQTQYDKAYYDIFIEEFKEKKFEKLSGLLEFIKNIFKTLKPKENIEIEKIIDIPYIIHKLDYDQFNNKKKLELFNFMLDFMERNQSSSNDDQLKKIRDLLKEKEINFPDIVVKIMDLVRNLIHDLEMLQQTFKR